MLKVYGDRPSVAAADGVDAGAPDLPHCRLHPLARNRHASLP